MISKDGRPEDRYTAPESISRRNRENRVEDRNTLRPPGETGIPEDSSLDASHVRMREALAAQIAMVHKSATKGGLTTLQLSQLADLANIWRVLVSHEPAPSLEDLSEAELRAQLDAVKKRSK